jgi:hypothetical protein
LFAVAWCKIPVRCRARQDALEILPEHEALLDQIVGGVDFCSAGVTARSLLKNARTSKSRDSSAS